MFVGGDWEVSDACPDKCSIHTLVINLRAYTVYVIVLHHVYLTNNAIKARVNRLLFRTSIVKPKRIGISVFKIAFVDNLFDFCVIMP